MSAAARWEESFDHPVADVVRFYRHGWHSWSPSGWFDPAAKPTPPVDRIQAMGTDHPEHPNPHLIGSGMAVVEHGDGSVTLLGALGLGAWVSLEQGALRGRSAEGPVDWFVAQGEESEVFGQFGEALGRSLGARPTGPRRVWCSWYGLYEEISEAQIRAVAVGLRGLDFDVLQVDDGWQRAVGDWEANPKFPSGMADLADRIESAGFVPGLWLAPLISTGGANTLRQHPEFRLMDSAGEPVVAGVNWGEPIYALDPTHPAVLEHLAAIIGRAREWGYRYLKLDFLYAGGLPGSRAGSVGPEAGYREAMAVMRKAAGDDCYLLACGAPMLSSLGIFDGIRIGPDVAEWWFDPGRTQGARNVIETSSGRLWLRDIIDVDPDVAFFRSHRMQLGPEARDMLRDLGRVAEFRGVSDPPAWLSSEQRGHLADYLEERPVVTRLGRHEWAIGGRSVDFSRGFSKTEYPSQRIV